MGGKALPHLEGCINWRSRLCRLLDLLISLHEFVGDGDFVKLHQSQATVILGLSRVDNSLRFSWSNKLLCLDARAGFRLDCCGSTRRHKNLSLERRSSLVETFDLGPPSGS